MYIDDEDRKAIITVLIVAPIVFGLFVGSIFLWRAMTEPSTEASTEANYKIDCSIRSPGSSILYGNGWDDDEEWYGVELTSFQVTTSGFWIYHTDGSVDWLSSGNACRIKEIKK